MIAAPLASSYTLGEPGYAGYSSSQVVRNFCAFLASSSFSHGNLISGGLASLVVLLSEVMSNHEKREFRRIEGEKAKLGI